MQAAATSSRSRAPTARLAHQGTRLARLLAHPCRPVLFSMPMLFVAMMGLPCGPSALQPISLCSHSRAGSHPPLKKLKTRLEGRGNSAGL
jgi:hypothetical protein